ncbi:MAG: hypothetical protein WCK76_14015, partial [Elusimicrobiota bacterium]
MKELPEINFKEKKEKRGLLPWLRSRLGLGGGGAIGGAGEALPGAANLGRAAFGAAKLGSGGLGGLLAGKLGLIATVVVVGGAIGTSLYMRMPDAPVTSTSSFNSHRTPGNYVPAKLRKTKAQGSSLHMFKEANKNALGDG